MRFLGAGVWDAAIPAWLKYADIPSSHAALKEAARRKWLETLQPAPTQEAIRGLDALLMALLEKHFGDAFGGDRMLDAFEYFGTNTLPLDEDRFQRSLAAYGPQDFRVLPDTDGIPPARAHRMDGSVMWFRWAAFLACAAEVHGPNDPHRAIRTTNLAAIATGCAFDFVFRGREHSRPEYTPTAATAKLLRQTGEFLATSWDEALRETQELYQLFT